MGYTIEVSDEAKKIHFDSVIIDGCSFFCEGYNDNLKESGVTALNITVPDTSADVEGAVRVSQLNLPCLLSHVTRARAADRWRRGFGIITYS